MLSKLMVLVQSFFSYDAITDLYENPIMNQLSDQSYLSHSQDFDKHVEGDIISDLTELSEQPWREEAGLVQNFLWPHFHRNRNYNRHRIMIARNTNRFKGKADQNFSNAKSLQGDVAFVSTYLQSYFSMTRNPPVSQLTQTHILDILDGKYTTHHHHIVFKLDQDQLSQVKPENFEKDILSIAQIDT